jgi:hypothetical protein
VAAFGRAAGVPASQTLAWGLAWPLTQLGLLWRPDLAHYGGLSGVLHAGVAATVMWLVVRGRGSARAIGIAVAVGLLVKLAGEQPWGPSLHHGEGWDIATAPLAHATGAISGALCSAIALACGSRPTP